MKPKPVGRTGSATKIYTSRKWLRRHAKAMLLAWGTGSGAVNKPPACMKRLRKLWHARLRRQAAEQCRTDS